MNREPVEFSGTMTGSVTASIGERPPTVAGFGHIEKVGARWNVPGIGRVTHEWLFEALGREPVDEEKVTTSVLIRPGIHL
jgi:hypothetical protein